MSFSEKLYVAKGFSFISEDQMQSIKGLCASISVPDELTEPHALTKDMIKCLNSSDLNISDKQKERIIRIFDTIFEISELLGYRIEIHMPFVYLISGNGHVKLTICEIPKRIYHIQEGNDHHDDNEYSINVSETDIVYGERLKLTASGGCLKRPMEWQDFEGNLIEDVIGEIILDIIKVLNTVKFKSDTEDEREMFDYRREAEVQKFNELLSNAEDYFQALKIYEYICHLESKALVSGKGRAASRVKDYIKWAREKADWLNPLIGGEDEFLGVRHKTT
ncbi:MAG TPA: hypothetical protein VF941_20200 [Clostridia bacterium]